MYFASIVIYVHKSNICLGEILLFIRTILPVYVGNVKGRGLLASTIIMVHPIGVETITGEHSEATMVSRVTLASTEATGVATSYIETLMN